MTVVRNEFVLTEAVYTLAVFFFFFLTNGVKRMRRRVDWKGLYGFSIQRCYVGRLEEDCVFSQRWGLAGRKYFSIRIEPGMSRKKSNPSAFGDTRSTIPYHTHGIHIDYIQPGGSVSMSTRTLRSINHRMKIGDAPVAYTHIHAEVYHQYEYNTWGIYHVGWCITFVQKEMLAPLFSPPGTER